MALHLMPGRDPVCDMVFNEMCGFISWYWDMSGRLVWCTMCVTFPFCDIVGA